MKDMKLALVARKNFTGSKERKLGISDAIELIDTIDIDKISDGYHSFKELYEFRMMYNAALFNEWAITDKYKVHKSYHHFDGEECFGGGWFIVVAVLPDGQITNHYKNKHWDLFKLPFHSKALFEYDGHNGADVLSRLKSI